MATITDLRIKIIHWFRNNGKIAFIAIVIFVTIFIINRYLMTHDSITVPNTTYTPQVSIMDEKSSAPLTVQTTAEQMIEEYVGYCNEGDYKRAFNMLSKDCQKYGFNDNLKEFAEYVLKKMPTPKKYSIQNYSNYKGYYIYEIKYIDDILSTGLTNQTYNYSVEKIVFSKNDQNSYDMSTGNFIKYDKINNVLENDYLKVDVIDRVTRYSVEAYTVKFTNRTDSTVVIADNLISDEVKLVLPQEYRSLENVDYEIVLNPGQNITTQLYFTKFFDDDDVSQGLLFNAVRVIENYKGGLGTTEEQKNEIENAIAKFSVEIPVK